MNEVGGFPAGDSGQPLKWIVDLVGINNRIIGLAATPDLDEVTPGVEIGNMLSNQKKAQMEQLIRRIR